MLWFVTQSMMMIVAVSEKHFLTEHDRCQGAVRGSLADSWSRPRCSLRAGEYAVSKAIVLGQSLRVNERQGPERAAPVEKG